MTATDQQASRCAPPRTHAPAAPAAQHAWALHALLPLLAMALLLLMPWTPVEAAPTTPADGPPGLGAWVHDLDPVIVNVAGGLKIRWYGLAYITGFAAGWALLVWLARRGALLMSPARVFDALTVLMLGVIVGGRLGYCLFYQPSLLWTFTSGFPFWQALNLTRGGMASHGGMIGVGLACWWISRGFLGEDGRRHGRVPLLHVGDAVVLATPVGLLLGRLANFINGELLGRIVAGPGEPAPWWSIRYPQELVERPEEWLAQAARTDPSAIDRFVALQERFTLPSDPVGLLEAPSAHEGGIAFVPAAVERTVTALQTGTAAERAEMARSFGEILTARAPSQLVQAFAEGVVTFCVVWLIARLPRRPGVISAWFLVTYGAGRILTEFVRLPDDHFADPSTNAAPAAWWEAARILGLTRGQWLSGLMVLAGAGLLVWVTRSGAQRVGGWLRTRTPTALPGAERTGEPQDTAEQDKPEQARTEQA